MLWYNVAGLRRELVQLESVASGSAAAQTYDYPIFEFTNPGRLRNVGLVFGAAITANANNYFNLQLGHQIYNATTGSHGSWTALDSTEATGIISGSLINYAACENIELYDADDDPNVSTASECAGRQYLAQDILVIRRTVAGTGMATPPILVKNDWDSAANVAGEAPTCDTD